MTRPDSRIVNTGRHPDLQVQARPSIEPGGIEQLRRMAVEANPRVGAGDFPTYRTSRPAEIAASFGLDAEKTRIAGKLLAQVAADTRDLYGIAKSAAEAGIPAEYIPALIKGGVELHHELDRLEKAGGKPGSQFGSFSTRGGGSGEEARGGRGGQPGAGVAGKQAGAGADSQAVPSVAVDVAERYAAIASHAAKNGARIKGSLQSHHPHDHLDRLELKLLKHVQGRQGQQVEQQAAAFDNAQKESEVRAREAAAREEGAKQATPSAKPAPGAPAGVRKSEDQASSAVMYDPNNDRILFRIADDRLEKAGGSDGA